MPVELSGAAGAMPSGPRPLAPRPALLGPDDCPCLALSGCSAGARSSCSVSHHDFPMPDTTSLPKRSPLSPSQRASAMATNRRQP